MFNEKAWTNGWFGVTLIKQSNMSTQSEYSVFLVDDDKMFLTSLKNSLQQKFGALLKISEYTTGEACIHDMQNPPDIVILDYYLSEDNKPDTVDGIKLLREIKATSKDSTVIMLSGQDKLQVAIDSVKNGAYEYISKSESAFVRIQNTLKNVIENIKAARESNKYMKLNISMALVILAIVLVDVIWYYSYHYTF
jgi:two-component system, OmpR family, response regulator